MPDTSTAVKSTSQLDVIMMTQNPGGKERSEQEFMALATGAGFSGIRYECFVCNFWVMEFFK
ncbi:caffeic acid 3-O-methyltransferase [Prunus yedoensis var. nudiflora]|nr:caffeic acid 3-O-methyltransferase [Prunus yedoensis var. nudiflora]